MRRVRKSLSPTRRPKANSVSSFSLESKNLPKVKTIYNRSIANDVSYIVLFDESMGGITIPNTIEDNPGDGFTYEFDFEF